MTCVLTNYIYVIQNNFFETSGPLDLYVITNTIIKPLTKLAHKQKQQNIRSTDKKANEQNDKIFVRPKKNIYDSKTVAEKIAYKKSTRTKHA